jgi:hypothetical protein
MQDTDEIKLRPPDSNIWQKKGGGVYVQYAYYYSGVIF